MSPCAWVVAWVACVGHRIEAAPIALRDGQALERLGASPGTWWSVELDGSTLRLRPVAEPGVGPPDENPGVHDATWAGTWAWTRDGGWTTP